MNNKKMALAGLVAGVALMGAVLAPENTYAATLPSEVRSVLDQVETIYTDLIDEYNAEHEEQLEMVETQGGAPRIEYKQAGVNAYTGLEYWEGYSVSGGLVQSGFFYTPVVELLTSLGFSEYSSTPVFPQFLNEETGVICALSENISCGSISQAKEINDNWLEYINGIGAAYYAATNEYLHLSYDDSSDPVIYDSDYVPYQYTQIGGGGGIAAFYRSSETSEWVYSRIAGGHSVSVCSLFTGEEAKGFAGLSCYDEEKQEDSVVTVPEEAEADNASDSGIGAPDTGFLTEGEDGSAVATTILAAVVFLGITAWLGVYAKERASGKVKFEEK